MLSPKSRFFNFSFLFVIILFVLKYSAADKPNIIFILADDLGWNDVGFHGSGQVPTPNIDALAYSGLILNNYYVAPICTPSRSALMTGKLPIHTGMQHTVLFGAEARGLPLSETLLPERLRAQGYTTRLVGKWHLGSYKLEYTPLYRGFDSHLGFWTGHQDYFDHTAMEKPGWGLDMRRNTELAYDLHGQYSTDIFSKEAVRLISTHNNTKPLFLYLAHAAVHSGNPYNPLPAPDNIVSKFDYIQNYNRRRFAAVLTKLDESVGMVVDALGKRGMLKNSIIVFSTDNGGPAEGFNLNAASNWPLRGVKNTLWEGGVRGAGLLWSPLIKKSKRVADQAMHISDWLPTLYNAAGGDTSDLGKIDGYNLWPALSNDDSSPRIETLHNIDDIYGSSAITVGEWKMVKGTNYNGIWDSWYGPSGREVAYNITMVKNSQAGRALQKINQAASRKDIVELRKTAEVQCARNITSPSSSSSDSNHRCQPLKKPCLFHVASDPCELNNLAGDFPAILQAMENTLQDYNRTAVRPGNKPLDPRGDPRFWEYTWTNFGDYSFKNNLLMHS